MLAISSFFSLLYEDDDLYKLYTSEVQEFRTSEAGIEMDEYRIAANFKNRELNDKTFDNNLLLQLNPLYWTVTKNGRIPSVKRVVVDLQQVRYANPYGALGIVVLCEILHRIFHQKVELLLPSDDGGLQFSSWLDSLGFLNAVEDIANIKGYCHTPHVNSNLNFIPVTRLKTWDDVFKAIDEIEAKVQGILVEKLEYSREEAYRFVTIISELCQNIYYHSAPDGNPHGYISMQAYSNNLKFAVMDLGIGIPKALKAKYLLDDDREAIRLACEAGITSKDRGGLGLYRTAQIVERAGGYLNIRSGTAKVLFTPRGRHYVSDRKVFSFWRTQIGILLPRKNESKGKGGGSDESEDYPF